MKYQIESFASYWTGASKPSFFFLAVSEANESAGRINPRSAKTESENKESKANVSTSSVGISISGRESLNAFSAIAWRMESMGLV